jgi:predicted membrane-bound spermidine synthase
MSAARPALSPTLAAILTFAAAACVLVLEIAAGRLLAPYVGVSLTTYTGIIGVILAGIALGAWLGGRLADRVAPDRVLGPTFVLGGLAAMAAVPVVGAVGALGLGTDPVAIVVLATVGFVLPAAILSAVAPLVVRASLTDVATSGRLVGRLSATGTAGAITGTFLTGFVLLGLAPTSLLIVATGALLAVVGLVLMATRGVGLAGLALVVVASVASAGVAVAAPAACERESAYYCMRITTDPIDPDGRTLVLDRVRHAYVDLADPTELEFRYVRWFRDASADLVAARDGAVDVLHVGGGGFTFPRYLVATAPASRHVVLELDREVLEIARERLGFRPDERIDVRIGDARTGVGSVPADAVDLVVGDAFGGLSVPWHLTTREFLAELDRTLRPEGRYVMNLIDGPRMRFVRAEVRTLRSVWEHVAVIGTAVALDGTSGGNVVLVASHEPFGGRDLAGRLEIGSHVIADPAELDAFVGDAPLLTDDFAPVDQLLVR